MNPDYVRGRLSSDAGATSNSINSPTAPSPMPMLSPTPSLTLSPVSTTSDNSNHRPFAGGLLRSSIGNLERRAILGPCVAVIIDARCSNVGMPKPLLHLGNVSLVIERVGGG